MHIDFVLDTYFWALPNVAGMFCPTPATVEKMMISLSIFIIFIGGSSTCTVDSDRWRSPTQSRLHYTPRPVSPVKLIQHWCIFFRSIMFGCLQERKSTATCTLQSVSGPTTAPRLSSLVLSKGTLVNLYILTVSLQKASGGFFYFAFSYLPALAVQGPSWWT